MTAHPPLPPRTPTRNLAPVYKLSIIGLDFQPVFRCVNSHCMLSTLSTPRPASTSVTQLRITSTMRSIATVFCTLLALLCTSSPAAAQGIKNDSTPIQQRIALQPNGMTVTWSTIGPIHVQPAIAYGTDPSQLDQSEKGWTRHYVPSISWFHHVVLNNLQPATTYYWQMISQHDVNSSVLSFTTAPKVGAHTPFTVSINGDMGLGNEDNSQRLLREWTDRIDLFWHVGDLSYADDYAALNTTYEHAQELWMNRMDGIWSERPYMFCPGQHATTHTSILSTCIAHTLSEVLIVLATMCCIAQ